PEDRKNPKNDGEWGQCGGGKVYLRKVQTSDFYVEPFLRDKPKPNTITAKPKTNSPILKSPPVVKKNATKTNNTPVRKKPIIIKPNSTPVTDTAQKITIAPVIKKPVTDKKIFTPE